MEYCEFNPDELSGPTEVRGYVWHYLEDGELRSGIIFGDRARVDFQSPCAMGATVELAFPFNSDYEEFMANTVPAGDLDWIELSPAEAAVA